MPGKQGLSFDVSLQMNPRPARDPLRTFVFEAADRAVCDVFVDGRPVVENGKPLHLDPERAGGELEESQARMLADAPRCP